MGFGCDDAWVATMASMVWMGQGCTDVGAPLLPVMVASDGGVDGWRRWVASMASVDGIDGGNWGLRRRGH